MKNKFNLILKTIESKNQTQAQVQAQSQIQSQVQTENLSSNLSQIQSQNQSQNQTKTYAQIAAANIEEDNLQQTKKQQKQQEKEKEKRLIIQIDKETAEGFDSYILRNKINDKFFTEANINQSVIIIVTKSLTSQSIILTIMSDFSADFLLQKKTI